MAQITRIRKRNGDVVPFDGEKIRNAISKAFESVGNYDTGLIEMLSEQATNIISNKFESKGIPSVEEVQDIVEITLINNDLAQIAKNYILYRQGRAKLRKQQEIEKKTQEEIAQFKTL